MNYSNPVYLASSEDVELNILNKNTLEIEYCYRRDSNTSPLKWNFVSNGAFVAPTTLKVTVNGVATTIASMSFRRRPNYMPLRARDFRIGNWLVINLGVDLKENDTVQVSDSSKTILTKDLTQVKKATTVTPVISVAQAGYNTNFVKKAFVGYYLGNGGELDLSYLTTFSVLDKNNNVVFSGTLKPRKDVGYSYTPLPYQKVLEADFTGFNTPGLYKIRIDDLGVSYSFNIHPKAFLGFARNFALGLLNQRCGAKVSRPFSRHEKNACHVKPAYIPMPAASFPETWTMIGNETNNTVNATNQLYPFVKTGTIDVSLGHHDAGDYSKYVVNSSVFIHKILCAIDNLGLGSFDNLGLPESTDGKSDLLSIVKHEADFVFKMFDDDGGVFHLVYPKTRAYELDASLQGTNVGDEQCVWVKTTIATAAASAALAELGSSPLFRQQFGTTLADSYIAQAKRGWTFLMNAIAKYGQAGSFQQVRGGEASHDGALCYVAAALFAATGDTQYSTKLFQWLPDAKNVPWQWGWRIMYGFYGCAVRSYAFSVRSGRRTAANVNATYLQDCDAQIVQAGDNAVRDSNNCAYGGAVTYENKGYSGGGNWGWYFLSEFGADLAFANKIAPNQKYIDAGVLNYGYIVGCNPINVSSMSGIGLRRPRQFVSNYQLNDTRTMPPNGQLRASISAGPGYIEGYKNPDNTNEGTSLVFPAEYDLNNKYPPQNRFIDQFNVNDEETLCQTHATGMVFSAWLASLT